MKGSVRPRRPWRRKATDSQRRRGWSSGLVDMVAASRCDTESESTLYLLKMVRTYQVPTYVGLILMSHTYISPGLERI